MVRAGTVLMMLLAVTLAVPTVAVADELPGEDEPIAGPGVTFNASDGPALTVGETTEFRNQNPWVSSHKIELEPWGWAYSNGPTAVNITEFNGTWTTTKEIDATGSDLTINPNDKERVTLGGGIQRFEWRDNIALDDATQDFRYGGPSGTAEVTLTEVPATTEIAAVDASSGEVLDAALSDGSGNVTFDDLPQSDHDVVLQSYSSSTPTASNLSPDGTSAETDPQNIQLSADVSDADFGRTSDEVVVEFYVDGSVVDTQTITSNQTVTTTISETTAGTNDWIVSLSDEFGNTNSIQSELLIANELKIYNESAPNTLVQNVDVSIEFYYRDGQGSGEIVTRSTTDGTINMSGLSATQPFVVVAQADGYVPRRIFVTTLTQTQSVYLLPENATKVQNQFEIQDLTGLFPEEDTVLQIQRNLDGEWRTVHGDFFGANGQFPGQLEYNTRHRLVIVNTETNQSRILGTYTPLTDSQEAISISPTGNITQQALNASFSVEPAAQLFPAEQISITPSLDAGATTISSWNTTAYLVTNNSITTLFTRQESSAGNFTETINLTGHANATVRIETEWTTASGYTQTRSLTYGIVPQSKAPSLIGNLNQLTTQVPQEDRDAFTTAIAIVVSLVATAAAGGALRLPGEASGFVGAMFVTGFGILGWVGYDLVFVVLVAWGALAFLGRRY